MAGIDSTATTARTMTSTMRVSRRLRHARRRTILSAEQRRGISLPGSSLLVRQLRADKPGGGIFSRMARAAHQLLLEPPPQPQQRCQCQANSQPEASAALQVTQRGASAAPDNTLQTDETDIAESSSYESSDRTGSVIDVTG